MTYYIHQMIYKGRWPPQLHHVKIFKLLIIYFQPLSMTTAIWLWDKMQRRVAIIMMGPKDWLLLQWMEMMVSNGVYIF